MDGGPLTGMLTAFGRHPAHATTTPAVTTIATALFSLMVPPSAVISPNDADVPAQYGSPLHAGKRAQERWRQPTSASQPPYSAYTVQVRPERTRGGRCALCPDCCSVWPHRPGDPFHPGDHRLRLHRAGHAVLYPSDRHRHSSPRPYRSGPCAGCLPPCRLLEARRLAAVPAHPCICPAGTSHWHGRL